ncbi:hypothetical protein [Pedobacter rhizosphaerae]|uniref:Uncharacterized protein n=1 Tax=Pedobacter rhizosphaerae TaxID=390241 RepID=A0A1H9L8I0_9SPHI|nr:hypothetical protein [Pedobacter rhizosphaerae]SER07726.1 hypothetical protein SAMN04488023_10442 [Pedobacter rhizosphaerae]
MIKQLYISLLLLMMAKNVVAQKQKVSTFQLMEPHFNSKVISGTITEVYTTQRYGKTFWWVKIGTDTIIHVWGKHLDTANMKPGLTRKFYSIKRLNNNWWKKEKSEFPVQKPNR